MLYDEKYAHTVLHFFVANFSVDIIVFNTNEFQVFPTISFTFRPIFLQISSQTRKSDFAKQKLSIEKRLTFFPTFAMNVFMLIEKKEFSNTLHIFCFFEFPMVLQFLRSKHIWTKYIVEKYIFQRLQYQLFIQSILSWIHSSEEASLVLDDCKMPVPFGHDQLSRYFLLFFIRSIPRVRRPTKNQIIASIAFGCEKNLGMLLTDIMVEKTLIVTIDQKSCKLLLICGRKRIYSSIFGWFCMYHFSFTKLRLQGVARFLLCRSFSG